MAERIWTKEQGDFINAKKGPILVSAAAGSGKTAAIVERVTRRLSDMENPLAADRLLMTTFSVAAAGEMQERIETALEKLLKDSPDNDFILGQIDKMQNANICTIHSLCFKIIRENFSHLGLTCDFRVVDEAEDEFIMRSALERVIKRAYDREEEHLESLIELICKFKNDRELSEFILKLYHNVISMPFPNDVTERWLQNYVNPEDTYEKWAQYVANRAFKNVSYAKELALINLDIAEGCAKYEIVENDAKVVAYIEKCIKELNLSEAYDSALSLEINNRSVPAIPNPADKSLLKDNRAAIRDAIEKTADLLAYTDKENFVRDQNILYPNVKLLFSLLCEFIEEFANAKREKNVLDFADAEQFSLSLLWQKDENGNYQTTDIAKNVAQRFDEIYIDEYQDVNAAQEMIFKAISHNGNVFMVGDVKQSIYGFRQADSDIFNEKRNTFYEYDGENFPATIFFDKNFRSRKGVTDFINQVFFKIMKKEVGGSDYTPKDALDAQAKYIENCDSGTSILLFESSGSATQWTIDEGKVIAQEIRRLLDSGYEVQDGDGMRPCRPSDFCILSRGKKKFPVYMDQLRKLSISARISKTDEDFFETREIRLVLGILRAISNPYDEISLAAAMMSPVFVFTPEMVADIKAENKYARLFDAVKEFAVGGNEKCQKFIDELRSLQRLAAAQNVDSLLLSLYEKYNIYNMVGTMECGDERMANLDMFRSYARQFEKNGYKGLSEFLRFINNIERNDKKLKGAVLSSENKDAVNIMTIHASKGLEFPICFLANCNATFNHEELSAPALIDKRLGFSCIIKDSQRAVKYAPLSYTSLKLAAEEKQIAEEQRILYVALTRAREKLIIPIVKTKIGEAISEAYINSLAKNEAFVITNSKNYAKLLLLSCAGASYMKNAYKAFADDLSPLFDGAPFEARVIDEVFEDVEEVNEIVRVPSNSCLIDKIRKAAAFEYSFKSQTDIPSKFSVSEILKSERDEAFDFAFKPDFMSENGMSGAERGIALHTFMQFADFNSAAVNLEAEIENVFTKGHISERQKQAIELSRLRNFFESSLFGRILNADKVMREYKFMTGIDSKQFGGSALAGDKVVLQGIADCVIIEGDTATIIDYKTDFVKNESELVDRYGLQLAIYKGAIEKLLGLKVKECLIYSFCLGKEISVETEQNII